MGLSFAFNLKPPRAVNKCICLAKSFLGRNWCWFIGISVCRINQATVFWQNSNEVEWIVINSLEGANHGHIPHKQSSHWPQWRTGVVKKRWIVTSSMAVIRIRNGCGFPYLVRHRFETLWVWWFRLWFIVWLRPLIPKTLFIKPNLAKQTVWIGALYKDYLCTCVVVWML